MPDTYLYRKNGGEVLGISTDASAYANIDSTYFATVTAPTLPNGRDLVPAKIHDNGTVRNATAGEITTFTSAAATDDNLIQRTAAKAQLDGSAALVNRKLLRALVETIIDEINILRAQHSLPARTLPQAVTSIKSKIDGGSFD